MPYQFTSHDFTSMLLKAEIAISMDARGSWRGNVFVERRWRSIKYEEVYLRAARGRTLLSMAHAAVRANQATSQRCLEREHSRFVPLCLERPVARLPPGSQRMTEHKLTRRTLK